MNPLARLINREYKESLETRGKFLNKLALRALSGLKTGKFDNYLDIGCGPGKATKALSCLARRSVGIDLKPKNIIMARKANKGITFAVGDVYELAYKAEFDLVSAISLLEHLENLDLALKSISEAQPDNGFLIVQIPNKYFFLELHTYLPFVYLIPLRARYFFLSKMGYTREAIIGSHLSKKELNNKIAKYYEKVHEEPIIFPLDLIPRFYRPFYRVLGKLQFFKAIPFGFLIIYKKMPA